MSNGQEAAGALRRLGRRDRREVLRAVRYGRVVDDPALAGIAVDHAQDVRALARRWSWRTPVGWPSLLDSYLRTVWPLIPVGLLLVVWFPDPGTVAIDAFLVFVLLYGLVRHATHCPLLAAQAEAANHALVAESRSEPVPPSLGEEPPAPRQLPWWTPRSFTRKSDPNQPGWLPIPLRYLIPVWTVWAGLMIALGLTASEGTQFWAVIAVFVLWFEVERRLAEPVEARLGQDAQRVRGYDVFRSGRGWRWSIFFALLLACEVGLGWLTIRSGWFGGGGGVAAFGLAMLLVIVYRDLASRWRWRHSSSAAPPWRTSPSR